MGVMSLCLSTKEYSKLEKQTLVEVNHEIERINEKVKNIEQIASTIETLAEHGLESWDKYLTQKDEGEKREADISLTKHQRELELENLVHKRSMIILGGCLISVVLLILVAMLKDQNELVKIILGSTLAVAGGAGITNMFKKNKDS